MLADLKDLEDLEELVELVDKFLKEDFANHAAVPVTGKVNALEYVHIAQGYISPTSATRHQGRT